MPVTMTYDSLVSDLENYLQRDDDTVVDMIPTFISFAQQRIPREMKILGFREEVTGFLDGTAQGTGIMQKPSDWRKTISFYVGIGTENNTHSPVYERTYEYIRQVFPDTTSKGTPRFYADADYNHWLIGPPPSSSLPFKIPYYGTLTLLDGTTQTNWLTINAPDMLLYASLMEAIPFVKADERIPVWQGMYAQAKLAFQTMEMEGLYDVQQISGEPQPSPPPGR